MNTLNGQDEGHEGMREGSLGASVADPASACSPELLLHQLHHVQEELEQYYLKCLGLDSELQVARLASDDAKREIQALKTQLQHMQRELQDAGVDRPGTGFTMRRILTRLSPGRFRQRAMRSKERDGQHAQLEAIRSSGWFDAAWSLASYPGVRDARMDPAEHYHEFGWKEGRNPSRMFDTNYYLKSYPDVASSNLDPLWHFIEYGLKEGRPPRES